MVADQGLRSLRQARCLPSPVCLGGPGVWWSALLNEPKGLAIIGGVLLALLIHAWCRIKLRKIEEREFLAAIEGATPEQRPSIINAHRGQQNGDSQGGP